MIAYMAAGAAVAIFTLGWILRGIFDSAHRSSRTTARRVEQDVERDGWDWPLAPTVSLPFDTEQLELALGRS